MAETKRCKHYEVLKREDGSPWVLAKGRTGILYKAYDSQLRRTVALMVANRTYLEDEIIRQTFLREVRAIAAVRDRNMAAVFPHVDSEMGEYFYATEFIDGETLDLYVKRKGCLGVAEAIGITLQVSQALAVIAKQNLVQRYEIKPAKLMLFDEEDGTVVKVIGFQFERAFKDSLITYFGDPQFVSPEQVEQQNIDIRSRIYSLGAILYYIVTGRPPFSGSLSKIMTDHLYKSVPLEPLESIHPKVTMLIQRMTEKDREKRPQTPLELRKEILNCLEQMKGPNCPPSTQA